MWGISNAPKGRYAETTNVKASEDLTTTYCGILHSTLLSTPSLTVLYRHRSQSVYIVNLEDADNSFPERSARTRPRRLDQSHALLLVLDHHLHFSLIVVFVFNPAVLTMPFYANYQVRPPFQRSLALATIPPRSLELLSRIVHRGLELCKSLFPLPQHILLEYPSRRKISEPCLQAFLNTMSSYRSTALSSRFGKLNVTLLCVEDNAVVFSL